MGKLQAHHSDGKVVVDDLVGHGVCCLLRVIWDHLDAPAVHEHQLTRFDLGQDVSQVRALIAWWVVKDAHRSSFSAILSVRVVLCFQDQKGLTSSPAQTSSQVVSSAQRQDSDWRSRLEVFSICNHTCLSQPLGETDESFCLDSIEKEITYSIQKPAHSAIPSTCQNPVFMQVTEEVQSGKKDSA